MLEPCQECLELVKLLPEENLYYDVFHLMISNMRKLYMARGM